MGQPGAKCSEESLRPSQAAGNLQGGCIDTNTPEHGVHERFRDDIPLGVQEGPELIRRAKDIHKQAVGAVFDLPFHSGDLGVDLFSFPDLEEPVDGVCLALLRELATQASQELIGG
mgnify:CR=1 FL=1